MDKIYEINVDFFREDIFNTNPIKDAEDNNIWFNKFDIGTSYIKAIFFDKDNKEINLTNVDISINWQLTNRELRLQEKGIEKADDIGTALITVPAEVINSGKGKCYFTITLKFLDTNKTLTTASYVITIVDSLSNSQIVNDNLLTQVKNAEKFNDRTYEEAVEDIAKKVGKIETEGLATEEYVDNALKEKADTTDLNDYVKNEDIKDVAKTADYTDLVNTPVITIKNKDINFNNLDVGNYSLYNVNFFFNNHKFQLNNQSSNLQIFKNDDIKSFVLTNCLASSILITYNCMDEVKRIDINVDNIVNKKDLESFVDAEYVKEEIKNGTVNFVDKNYIVESCDNLQETINKNNLEFRDIIYKHVLDVFAQVPSTFLTNYATKDYVLREITDAVTNINVEGGMTKEEVVKIIDEKLAGVEVDLTNYFTKKETEELIDSKNYITMQNVEDKNYLTKEKGDALYMPYKNSEIDDYKPKIGEYKTILKGDFYKKYHQITDFWPTNIEREHELKRPIRYVKRIADTNYFYTFIDNNGSEFEKGFSIFHFVTNKSLEEDKYISMSSLGLTIQDNNPSSFRILFNRDNTLISIIYLNAAKETRLALLSANVENLEIKLEDEIVVRTNNIQLINAEGQYSSDFAATENFDRVVMLLNEGATTAKNIVFFDIEKDKNGVYKYVNKQEYISYSSEIGNYFSANLCFLDKNNFIVGFNRSTDLYKVKIDDLTNTLSFVKMKETSEICNIIKVKNFLFFVTNQYNNNQNFLKAYKIEDDLSLTFLDNLDDTNLDTNNNALDKYCPQGTTRLAGWNTRGPAFTFTKILEKDNKIVFFETGREYNSFWTVYSGNIVFNTVTQKFEYYYPNFSYIQRQFTCLEIYNNILIGCQKNIIYLHEIKNDEPLVCQCGNNILYSYIENMREETKQVKPTI